MALSSWNPAAAAGVTAPAPSFDSDAPAFEEWSVDRITTASAARVCHMLFVRHRSGLAARLVIATAERSKLREVEANVHCALHTLTCAAFVRLFDLDRPSQKPGPDASAPAAVTH